MLIALKVRLTVMLSANAPTSGVQYRCTMVISIRNVHQNGLSMDGPIHRVPVDYYIYRLIKSLH